MISDALTSFLPGKLLPAQLLNDIAESEQMPINKEQDQEFMLRLVVFLNDFGHLCTQYVYGVDFQLTSQELSKMRIAELQQQRQWAEDANDYVQLFCKILGDQQIVKPRTLLFIIRKYIPCALVASHNNASEVLDRLQDRLMVNLPDVGGQLRLSNLWSRFQDACGGLIEQDVMEDLWTKLCDTVRHAHA